MSKTTNRIALLLTVLCICAGGAPSPAPGEEPAALPSALGKFTNPEPIAFMMMRQLDAMEPGMASYKHRQKIKQWQIRSHERWRRAGSRQMHPKDFIRLRRLYERRHDEAKDAIRKARHARRGRSSSPRSRDGALAPGIAELLRDPAQTWADPLIESFLLGIVEYQKRSYGAAISRFAKCIEQAPRVAAFHQGRAMALLGMNRPIDALASATVAMKLRPDAREALDLVRRAMQAVPGSQIGDPVFVAAAELVARHKDGEKDLGKAPATVRWLMPSKTWPSKPGALPEPTFDRMVFRQCIGVAVNENNLVVDRSVAVGAVELFVRINDKELAPCKVRRIGSAARAISVPLAAVAVPGYAFAPVELAEAEELSVGQEVSAYGLGVYEEMGKSVRQMFLRIESVDPNGRIELSGGRMLPGEAAGPVLTAEGKLLGFMGPKTDVMRDGGGPDVFADAAELAPELKGIRKSRPQPRWMKNPEAPPTPVEGKFFVVFATFAEKFE